MGPRSVEREQRAGSVQTRALGPPCGRGLASAVGVDGLGSVEYEEGLRGGCHALREADQQQQQHIRGKRGKGSGRGRSRGRVTG